MGFYLVVISSLYSTFFSFMVMIFARWRPPKKWSSWCYSKSRFAKWFEKKRERSRLLGPSRIDLFHLSSFVIFSTIGFLSIVTFLFDIFTSFLLTNLLGKIGILVTCLLILFIPMVYEAFLAIWWLIVNRNSPTDKQLKQIVKEDKENKKKIDKINKK